MQTFVLSVESNLDRDGRRTGEDMRCNEDGENSITNNNNVETKKQNGVSGFFFFLVVGV